MYVALSYFHIAQHCIVYCISMPRQFVVLNLNDTEEEILSEIEKLLREFTFTFCPSNSELIMCHLNLPQLEIKIARDITLVHARNGSSSRFR